MIETVFNVLKISVIVAICATFMVAINTFIGFVGSGLSTTIVGEIFSLISMYLPFNASVIFGGILTACIAILSFKIAKKIFDLTSWGISAV